MKKITSIICVMFALLMVFALPAGAATPYQTYTYSVGGTALYSPDAYAPAKRVDSTYMGLDVAITDPADLETDDEQNVYIADTGNNRIVVLDRYYKVKFIIKDFINEHGVPDNLTTPKGVFITSDKTVNGENVPGRIFVCDTGANRIVTFDRDGKFLSIIPEPESELLGQDAVYSPVAVAVDQYDRMYVVSDASSEGVFVMTDEGEFTGFIGAQKAAVSLMEVIWRRFQTEEQRKNKEKIVGRAFNNITINSDGFVYVTIDLTPDEEVAASAQSAVSSKSKSGDFAPVKMLNAAGDEIMRRNGFYPPSGEVDFTTGSVTDTIRGISKVVDVAVGPESTWTIADNKRSKVFTYDYDGNLLFAFGDKGTQLGNIDVLGAVTYQGDKMLLLDTNSFTVYDRTDYGNILIKALENQNDRQYDKAIDDWTEILKRNSNFDTAYVGIGNALYRVGDYDGAMEHYKSAYDTANYSNAFKEIRKEWISKYIILIPIIVIVLVLAWSKFMKFAAKVNKATATSGEKRTYVQELLYVFHVMFHPFDGFWDLKHEKRGSLRAGVTILGVTIIGFYYQAIGKGYIANPMTSFYTIFAAILSVVVPLMLWIISNWCLTTLFEGEGSFKDIFVATTYALIPLPLLMIPATVATNFVLEEELGIVNLLVTFGFIWAGLLIFCGTMVTHDFSLGKNFITVLATILGMVVIMFVAILFSTLLTKLVGFVTNIVTELQYRA